MMLKILIAFSIIQISFISTTYSQSVSINTTGNSADTSAILDISSSKKGILITRMTQAERLPAEGLLVYQSDGSKGFYFYNAVSGWTILASSAGGIALLNGLTANAQTFAAPNTIGTAPNRNSSGSAHTLNIPISGKGNGKQKNNSTNDTCPSYLPVFKQHT